MQMTAVPPPKTVDGSRKDAVMTLPRQARAEPPGDVLFPEFQVERLSIPEVPQPRGTAPSTTLPFASSPDAVRAAGRAAALRTSMSELEQYHAERREIDLKSFHVALTTVERRRLRYVEWQISRVEDAQLGPALDAFEAIVFEQRRIGDLLERHISTFEAKRRRGLKRQWHKVYGNRTSRE
jgi:hypothetical protein